MVIVWTVVLIVQATLCLVLLVSNPPKYRAFTGWMIADLLISVTLYDQQSFGALYDPLWRGAQLALLLPMAWAVMEAYRNLAADLRYWRFTDFYVIPTAGCAALIFRLAQDRPLRWPWSSLEETWTAISVVCCFLGLALFAVMFSASRKPLRRTVEYLHAVLLCAYLAGNCLYYAGLSRFRFGPMPIIWMAGMFYLFRLAIVFPDRKRVVRVMPPRRVPDSDGERTLA